MIFYKLFSHLETLEPVIRVLLSMMTQTDLEAVLKGKTPFTQDLQARTSFKLVSQVGSGKKFVWPVSQKLYGVGSWYLVGT